MDTLFKDNGVGGIYLYNAADDAFFILNRTEAGQSAEPVICAVDIDGNEIAEYGSGEIIAVDVTHGVIIANSYTAYRIEAVDISNGERKSILQGDYTLLHYNAGDGVLFMKIMSIQNRLFTPPISRPVKRMFYSRSPSRLSATYSAKHRPQNANTAASLRRTDISPYIWHGMKGAWVHSAAAR
jgi:hypothetical protein